MLNTTYKKNAKLFPFRIFMCVEYYIVKYVLYVLIVL